MKMGLALESRKARKTRERKRDNQTR